MDKLSSILGDIRPDLDFKSSLNFVNDGFLDSLDLIRLVHELEVNFQISIPAHDINPENFKNVDSINALIERCGPRK